MSPTYAKGHFYFWFPFDFIFLLPAIFRFFFGRYPAATVLVHCDNVESSTEQILPDSIGLYLTLQSLFSTFHPKGLLSFNNLFNFLV